MRTRVSVFIPTWNAGHDLDALLHRLRNQRDVDLEILITDSSSTDGITIATLKKHGIAFETITQRDFNHGAVRNAAARKAEGEFLAFLSQDALPAGDDYMLKMLEPFEDQAVCASFAAQIPRENAHPFQLLNLERHMEESTDYEVRRGLSLEDWREISPEERIARIRFDDVASLIRRSALLKQPFEERDFGEDLAWSRSLILAGGAIAFCPRARVQHSHGLSLHEFSKRTAEVHQLLRELCDFLPMENRVVFLRRVLGTTLRFMVAAWTRGRMNPIGRVWAMLSAPYWASVQMTAMWRGSGRGRYQEPR